MIAAEGIGLSFVQGIKCEMGLESWIKVSGGDVA